MAKAFVALAIALFVAALGLGIDRVAFHERRERAFRTETARIGDGASIRGQVPLFEGQSVTFEACSSSRFPESFRDALVFEVIDASEGAVALEAPLDSARLARVRRSATHACVTLGHADRLGVSSTFGFRARALDPARSEIAAADIVFRVLARDHATDADLLPVLLGLLAGLCLIVGLALAPWVSGDDAAFVARLAPGAAAALAIGALVLAFALPSFVPIPGSLGGLVRATVLVSTQLLALGLARLSLPPSRRTSRLGFTRPLRSRLAWASAPVVGFVLHRLGGFFVLLVPSTGTAPVEAFVSFTSGFLVVSLVGVIAPVVEELFFRGLLYGLVEEAAGANAATAASALAFALVHLPQDFGAWGSLASIAFLGLALTLFRRLTGSSLLPAVAHLVHNTLVTLVALAAHT